MYGLWKPFYTFWLLEKKKKIKFVAYLVKKKKEEANSNCHKMTFFVVNETGLIFTSLLDQIKRKRDSSISTVDNTIFLNCLCFTIQ
jgi:hypothetical protein